MVGRKAPCSPRDGARPPLGHARRGQRGPRVATQSKTKERTRLMPGSAALEAWVEECARLTQPDRIVWCDGSEREYDEVVGAMAREGAMTPLNAKDYPNSFLYR